jgi:hypothetical protein
MACLPSASFVWRHRSPIISSNSRRCLISRFQVCRRPGSHGWPGPTCGPVAAGSAHAHRAATAANSPDRKACCDGIAAGGSRPRDQQPAGYSSRAGDTVGEKADNPDLQPRAKRIHAAHRVGRIVKSFPAMARLNAPNHQMSPAQRSGGIIAGDDRLASIARGRICVRKNH